MSFKDKILKNQSPWGSSPEEAGRRMVMEMDQERREPPNIDDLIKKLQKIINKFIPGGKSGGSKPIILGLVIFAVVWGLSGLYRVLPDEQGVVSKIWKICKNNSTWFELSYTFSS